ncbi:MAG: AAA family ATPase [Pseudomonadota bacterium]
MNDHANRYRGALKTASRPRDRLTVPQPLRFRSALEDELERALRSRESVLLVGEPGDGKTSLIASVDRRLRKRNSLKIVSFSANEIQAGCVYVGEWQSKLDVILKEAIKERAVLHLVDIWNFLKAGTASNVKASFWDMIQQEIKRSKGVQVIGEVTPDTFAQLAAIPHFLSDFQIIKVPRLADDEYQSILDEYAGDLGMTLAPESLQKLSTLVDTFLPQNKGLPGAFRALEALAERMTARAIDVDQETLQPSLQDVEATIIGLTGLPEFVVSSSARLKTSDMKRWFRQRIIGQERAVDAVIETIALYKAGLNDPTKPIGSFLFVGPSGVGKTELAKALAEFLFGSAQRLLRFDLSEFAKYESIDILLGSASGQNSKARLLDPVRSDPFQVILFDEVEKASISIHDVMLQLLDEGRVSAPSGSAVNFRQTIFIATTNAGASAAVKPVPGFGNPVDPEFDRDRALREMEAYFRPELLNRFQNIVPFHPLTRDQVLLIAELELKRVLKRQGLINRDIAVDVSADVLKHVVQTGYDVRYGGRALQRTIQKQIVLPIAITLMERAPSNGSIIQVYMRDGEVAVGLIRGADDEAKPGKRPNTKSAKGQRLSIEDIPKTVEAKRAQIKTLREQADINKMHGIIQDVDREREAPDFWNDARRASGRFALQSRFQDYVQSFHSLRDDLQALETTSASVKSKSSLQKWVRDFDRFEAQFQKVERELVAIGDELDYPALVRITPLTPYAEHIEVLYRMYADWAARQNFTLDLLCQPLRASEPILMLFDGAYAYGYLRLENGLHRIRQPDAKSIVFKTEVVMWNESGSADPLPRQAISSTALNQKGVFGEPVRSRVEVPEHQILLQNAKTIFENNELLPTVVSSLDHHGSQPDQVVRSYDLDPFVLHDTIGDHTSSAQAIAPDVFHELLCKRIDADLADQSG